MVLLIEQIDTTIIKSVILHNECGLGLQEAVLVGVYSHNDQRNAQQYHSEATINWLVTRYLVAVYLLLSSSLRGIVCATKLKIYTTATVHHPFNAIRS